jgi:acid phosphatase type 7
LQTGFGNLVFNITNLREDISFHFFTNGTEYPILLATSLHNLSMANIDYPSRNRIIALSQNRFQLFWSSHNSSLPQLQWGNSSGSYSFIESAEISRAIDRNLLCGAPANAEGYHDMGQLNRADFYHLDQLALDRVYYRFGDAATDIWSDESIFFIPPAPGVGSRTRPTRIALLADLGIGSSSSSKHTFVWQEEGTPAAITSISIGYLAAHGLIDAVFISGDISYANGILSSWDFFLDMISPITGHVPLLTTVGNHEVDWLDSSSSSSRLPYLKSPYASGGECGVVSSSLLPMPCPASLDEPWWSYEIGLIHFIGMSTEHDYNYGSKQYLFLENDLRSVDRSVTPWIIFSGHRPFYADSDECCLYGTDTTVMQSLRQNLEALLNRYRVSLVFSGHFHDYQRLSAIYDEQVIQHAVMLEDEDGTRIALHDRPDAPVYMIVGSAGNGPSYPSAFYSYSEANYSNVFGYAIVSAENHSHLHWSYIESESDRVIDRMLIIQDLREDHGIIGEYENGIESSSNPWLFSLYALLAFSLLIIIYHSYRLIRRWLGRDRALHPRYDRLEREKLTLLHQHHRAPAEASYKYRYPRSTPNERSYGSLQSSSEDSTPSTCTLPTTIQNFNTNCV